MIRGSPKISLPRSLALLANVKISHCSSIPNLYILSHTIENISSCVISIIKPNICTMKSVIRTSWDNSDLTCMHTAPGSLTIKTFSCRNFGSVANWPYGLQRLKYSFSLLKEKKMWGDPREGWIKISEAFTGERSKTGLEGLVFTFFLCYLYRHSTHILRSKLSASAFM